MERLSHKSWRIQNHQSTCTFIYFAMSSFGNIYVSVQVMSLGGCTEMVKHRVGVRRPCSDPVLLLSGCMTIWVFDMNIIENTLK